MHSLINVTTTLTTNVEMGLQFEKNNKLQNAKQVFKKWGKKIKKISYLISKIGGKGTNKNSINGNTQEGIKDANAFP